MRVTPRTLQNYKKTARPIVTLTAWDYAIARLVDQAGVDVILVGDSLAMVALGYENTLPVTLEAMIHHTQAVCRGVKNALVVSDLPFLTYQESLSQAIHTAGRILKETTAQAIKLEGGHPAMAETVERLTRLGVPVMGHVGLTPQSVHTLGYRQQGNTELEATRVIQEAIALEQAGAFAVVLEHIPATLAQTITEKLTIPTIGIGAGRHCDGQVLVTADLLGLSEKAPPFAKQYLDLDNLITNAVQRYSDDVRTQQFPPHLGS
ncbi:MULTISPECIES: 3-methyl-2-oxobutanoate hydroxymethyltransferase [Cyanophyceae]|uniref:3-methyl-2-oxobutanoate hydroxymethyltransferase n=1 Tax=Picosynechococcus sp. (strain ATCC 27264 / PCC 7002 / PR-6) TaxID=32049 RepID=PANB_PICP2|nr:MULTISPECIES: 3-methyl-2-oxobutanoate hydroxymethyltransferase [Cyanophyceae]B1XQ35.1 RecName: Full=3-methyl-2-oxobutanoate hydroxymethyltransferase; AltName: Full=Ketopantoate hydroxymethyltransferase; Short=KPHMT [Picosynechococcus sp. PCC 7002]ACA99817.1 3-methyl-2-oxobutanoate hydroxymethyltransferase [Picosynechococcus sp. PCC 7002]AMA09499.1 3-methyl-2-oxobutanoate hydroxymethyltransferase [Picosynechococcus sp. PCC 73109]ANV90834.1 3-methyl-2-oxobutanoate hydroxymethyltransferase [Pic